MPPSCDADERSKKDGRMWFPYDILTHRSRSILRIAVIEELSG